MAYTTLNKMAIQESRAVAKKPHNAVVKFRVASCGPPCDSTALLQYFEYTQTTLTSG